MSPSYGLCGVRLGAKMATRQIATTTIPPVIPVRSFHSWRSLKCRFPDFARETAVRWSSICLSCTSLLTTDSWVQRIDDGIHYEIDDGDQNCEHHDGCLDYGIVGVANGLDYQARHPWPGEHRLSDNGATQ